MKIFTTLLFSAIILLTSVNAAAAQEAKDSLWAVDFVRTKDGHQADYLQFIERNWMNARRFMKDKGIVASYRVLSAPAAPAQRWDVLLITEYVDPAGYAKREEVFEEYRKDNPALLSNGKSSRQLADIQFSGVYTAPPAVDMIWEIMLKTQNTDLETAAVRAPLENYLKGHATGNPDFMRKAFHTDGNLLFIRDGKFTTRSFAEYIAGMNGKPAPDEDKRRRWIETVETAGNAAVGKIILDYPGARFVDYMTLLKINGEWKIVNKSFFVEPKPNK